MYPTEHACSPSTLAGASMIATATTNSTPAAASPFKQQQEANVTTTTTVIHSVAREPDNTNPNSKNSSRTNDDADTGTDTNSDASGTTAFTIVGSPEVVSLCDPLRTPAKSTHTLTRVAPFLEMEEEGEDNEGDEEEDDHLQENCEDGLLEDVRLNDGDDDDIVVNEGHRGAPLEEEKKEEDDRDFVASSGSSSGSSSSSSSCTSPVLLAQQRSRGLSCGKRPRNSRRVSFAPVAQWSSIHNIPLPSAVATPTATPTKGTPNNNNSANHQLHLEQQWDSIDSSQHRYIHTSLVQVRETIHLSDYSPEESLASWYTYADLKSFKRERKVTARLIDNGLLPLAVSSMSTKEMILDDPDTEKTVQSDIYIDTLSTPVPIVYCSRGVENCTDAISRIRYRHIADGWRAVLNTQEKYYYQQHKLASMSSTEQVQYRALASFLGVGRNKASRKSWFSTNHGNNHESGSSSSSCSDSSNSNSNSNNNNNNNCSSPKSSCHDNPSDTMCCPYELAAAYQFTSVASLDIARNRALDDERHVAFQEQQAQRDTLGRLRLRQVAAAAIAAAHATSLLLNPNIAVLDEPTENQEVASKGNGNDTDIIFKTNRIIDL